MKIGDTVEVIDDGYAYTTYTDWAEKHGLENFTFGGSPIDRERRDPPTIGKVIAKGLHSGDFPSILSSVRMLYGVCIEGKDFIIEEAGLRFVKRKVTYKG